MTIYLGKRRRGLRLNAPTADYDADAVIYWGVYASSLTAARKTLDSNLFINLKADGLFAKLDCFWVFAHEVEALSLRNLVKRAHDCTKTGAPTWTQDRGYTGTANVADYLNTNFNPSTQGVNFLLNSACFGAYVRNNAGTTTVEIGVSVGGHRTDMVTRTAANQTLGSINSNANFVSIASITNSQGLTAFNRSASNAQQAYKNGSQNFTNSGVSVAIPNGNLFVLARNTGAGADLPSSKQVALAFAGGTLTSTEHGALFTRSEAYLDAIGAGVI